MQLRLFLNTSKLLLLTLILFWQTSQLGSNAIAEDKTKEDFVSSIERLLSKSLSKEQTLKVLEITKSLENEVGRHSTKQTLLGIRGFILGQYLLSHPQDSSLSILQSEDGLTEFQKNSLKPVGRISNFIKKYEHDDKALRSILLSKAFNSLHDKKFPAKNFMELKLDADNALKALTFLVPARKVKIELLETYQKSKLQSKNQNKDLSEYTLANVEEALNYEKAQYEIEKNSFLELIQSLSLNELKSFEPLRKFEAEVKTPNPVNSTKLINDKSSESKSNTELLEKLSALNNSKTLDKLNQIEHNSLEQKYSQMQATLNALNEKRAKLQKEEEQKKQAQLEKNENKLSEKPDKKDESESSSIITNETPSEVEKIKKPEPEMSEESKNIHKQPPQKPGKNGGGMFKDQKLALVAEYDPPYDNVYFRTSVEPIMNESGSRSTDTKLPQDPETREDLSSLIQVTQPNGGVLLIPSQGKWMYLNGDSKAKPRVDPTDLSATLQVSGARNIQYTVAGRNNGERDINLKALQDAIYNDPRYFSTALKISQLNPVLVQMIENKLNGKSSAEKVDLLTSLAKSLIDYDMLSDQRPEKLDQCKASGLPLTAQLLKDVQIEEVEKSGRYKILNKPKAVCVSYAETLVDLIRVFIIGKDKIPTRVVNGYRGDKGKVYNLSAHAWVEVYIPGRGWTIKEPTGSPSSMGNLSGAMQEMLERDANEASAGELNSDEESSGDLNERSDVISHDWHLDSDSKKMDFRELDNFRNRNYSDNEALRKQLDALQSELAKSSWQQIKQSSDLQKKLETLARYRFYAIVDFFKKLPLGVESKDSTQVTSTLQWVLERFSKSREGANNIDAFLLKHGKETSLPSKNWQDLLDARYNLRIRPELLFNEIINQANNVSRSGNKDTEWLKKNLALTYRFFNTDKINQLKPKARDKLFNSLAIVGSNKAIDDENYVDIAAKLLRSEAESVDNYATPSYGGQVLSQLATRMKTKNLSALLFSRWKHKDLNFSKNIVSGFSTEDLLSSVDALIENNHDFQEDFFHSIMANDNDSTLELKQKYFLTLFRWHKKLLELKNSKSSINSFIDITTQFNRLDIQGDQHLYPNFASEFFPKAYEVDSAKLNLNADQITNFLNFYLKLKPHLSIEQKYQTQDLISNVLSAYNSRLGGDMCNGIHVILNEFQTISKTDLLQWKDDDKIAKPRFHSYANILSRFSKDCDLSAGFNLFTELQKTHGKEPLYKITDQLFQKLEHNLQNHFLTAIGDKIENAMNQNNQDVAETYTFHYIVGVSQLPEANQIDHMNTLVSKLTNFKNKPSSEFILHLLQMKSISKIIDKKEVRDLLFNWSVEVLASRPLNEKASQELLSLWAAFVAQAGNPDEYVERLTKMKKALGELLPSVPAMQDWFEALSEIAKISKVPIKKAVEAYVPIVYENRIINMHLEPGIDLNIAASHPTWEIDETSTEHIPLASLVKAKWEPQIWANSEKDLSKSLYKIPRQKSTDKNGDTESSKVLQSISERAEKPLFYTYALRDRFGRFYYNYLTNASAEDLLNSEVQENLNRYWSYFILNDQDMGNQAKLADATMLIMKDSSTSPEFKRNWILVHAFDPFIQTFSQADRKIIAKAMNADPEISSLLQWMLESENDGFSESATTAIIKLYSGKLKLDLLSRTALLKALHHRLKRNSTSKNIRDAFSLLQYFKSELNKDISKNNIPLFSSNDGSEELTPVGYQLKLLIELENLIPLHELSNALAPMPEELLVFFGQHVHDFIHTKTEKLNQSNHSKTKAESVDNWSEYITQMEGFIRGMDAATKNKPKSAIAMLLPSLQERVDFIKLAPKEVQEKSRTTSELALKILAKRLADRNKDKLEDGSIQTVESVWNRLTRLDLKKDLNPQVLDEMAGWIRWMIEHLQASEQDRFLRFIIDGLKKNPNSVHGALALRILPGLAEFQDRRTEFEWLTRYAINVGTRLEDQGLIRFDHLNAELALGLLKNNGDSATFTEVINLLDISSSDVHNKYRSKSSREAIPNEEAKKLIANWIRSKIFKDKKIILSKNPFRDHQDDWKNWDWVEIVQYNRFFEKQIKEGTLSPFENCISAEEREAIRARKAGRGINYEENEKNLEKYLEYLSKNLAQPELSKEEVDQAFAKDSKSDSTRVKFLKGLIENKAVSINEGLLNGVSSLMKYHGINDDDIPWVSFLKKLSARQKTHVSWNSGE